jgi:glycosyltransferase involved in cell wall biosynthesis
MSTKLLYFVTEDWYFCSHRLPLAIAARDAGFDVTVVTRVREHGETIRAAGLTLIPFEIARSGMNPLRELATLWKLIILYRHIQPDIVHHVAMKPVLYGSFASYFTSVSVIVNALAGMGWLFTSAEGATSRLVKCAVRMALRRLLVRGIALVQNPDDAEMLARLGVPRGNIRRIAGSGVDLVSFHPEAEPEGVPMIVLPARLLWDKGVGEFVDAARLLKSRGVNARFVLVGDPDPANPASISAGQVADWVQQGAVEHMGWVNDMPNIMAHAHIVCLPSYREGLPKALIEAAAAARPIVTTNVTGCREVVENGVHGFCVPPHDVDALADALARLIADPVLRARMGASARKRAEADFGLDAVIAQTLALYLDVST